MGRSAAGSSSTGSPTRPSRWPTRSSPASCSPRSPACRCCSAAAPAIVVAALAIAAAGAGAGRQPRRRVGVVVTTLFGLGVLLALSPDSPPGSAGAPLRRHPRPHRRRPARPRRLAGRGGRRRRCCCCTGGCWRPASTARARALARRSRRGSTEAALLRPAGRWRSSSPSRASATCSSSPSSSARPRPPASSPTGSCRCSRSPSRSRCSPASPASTSPITPGTAGGASIALAIVAAYLLSLPRRSPAPRAAPSGPPRRLRSVDDGEPRSTPPGPSTRSRRCSEAGLRRGGARTAVVEALARHDCAVTALELDDELRRRKAARSAAPASTGRSSSSRSWAWCSASRSRRGTAGYERVDPGGHHHHHAICRSCGRMEPFEDRDLERAIERVSRPGPLRGRRARRRPARPLRALRELTANAARWAAWA